MKKMNLKKVLAVGLSAMMAMSAMSISAFAEKAEVVTYDPETGTVTVDVIEEDTPESPIMPLFLASTTFSKSVTTLQSGGSQIPIRIPVKSGESIKVDFDDSYDCYYRLYGVNQGYVMPWSNHANVPYLRFSGFEPDDYYLYLAAYEKRTTMSGCIYTN